MKVEITNLDNDKTYVANSLKGCKNVVDKNVYELVIKHQTVITIGKTIGRLIP